MRTKIERNKNGCEKILEKKKACEKNREKKKTCEKKSREKKKHAKKKLPTRARLYCHTRRGPDTIVLLTSSQWYSRPPEN